MDAPTTPPADGFDVQRPEARGLRWMVRGHDGRSAGTAWEVEHGEGAEAMERAMNAMASRYEGRHGARVELHLEKACGVLHLHSLLDCDHDGAWRPFVCPLDRGSVLPVRLIQAPMPAAPTEPAITAKGGRA